MSTRPQDTEPAVFLDPSWLSALDFARRHIAPGDTLAAPVEFAFHFPQALACSPFHRGRTSNPQWIVFHKDSRLPGGGFDSPALTTEYVPVWANEVFIIFQLRSIRPPTAVPFLRRLASKIQPVLTRWAGQRADRLPVPGPRPTAPGPGHTAIVMITHHEPSALARSLPQVLALEVPVLLVAFGIPENHREAYDSVLAAHRHPRLEILSLPQNPGVAAALNIGLFYWLADPAIEWISCFQDVVNVHPDLLRKLALVQDADERPLLSGTVSPGGLSLGSEEINGIRMERQWGSPGQHLHAHRRYWELVLPVPTPPPGPLLGGRAVETGWWITVMAPGALWKKRQAVPCLPGLVRGAGELPADSNRPV